MRYIKVREDTSLIRDEETNALINTNLTEYKNYMELKKVKDMEKMRLNQIENDILMIKNDIAEIKILLNKL
jgi:hypothetical protein